MPEDILSLFNRMEALAAKATEGPWEATTVDSIGGSVVYGGDGAWLCETICEHRTSEESNANAAFIAAARTAIPELCAALRRVDALSCELGREAEDAGPFDRFALGVTSATKRIADRIRAALNGTAEAEVKG